MEAAATPLRHPRITVLANRVLVDGLAIDDPTVVELVRARVEAGDDPAAVVADALEIGARVLNRVAVGTRADLRRVRDNRGGCGLPRLDPAPHELHDRRVVDRHPIDRRAVGKDGGVAESEGLRRLPWAGRGSVRPAAD